MIDAGIVLSLLAEKQAEVLSLRQRIAELERQLAPPEPPRPVRLVVPKDED